MKGKRRKRKPVEPAWRVQEVDEEEARRRWQALKRYWAHSALPAELDTPNPPFAYITQYTFTWGTLNDEIVVVHEPTRTFAYMPMPEYSIPRYKWLRVRWWLNLLNRVQSKLASETPPDGALPPILPKGKAYVTIYGTVLEITWEGDEIPFVRGDKHAK